MGTRLRERSDGALMGSQDVTGALRAILLMAAAGGVVVAIVALADGDRPELVVGSVTLASVLTMWWVAGRGHPTLASVVLVITFDALALYAASSGAGIRDAALMMFPLVIIISGVLLERRLSLVLSLLVFISGVGLGVAELTGLLATRFSHLTRVSDVINIAVLLAIATGLVDVLSSAVRNGIKRTRELQEKVQQAEKLRAVGLLAKGVAHDFNNQLTGILGNANLLEAKLPPDSDEASYVQSIVSCTRRSADLTRQLLAFARKGHRQNEIVDVDELVESVRLLLARSIDKRIELVHVPSERPATVRGDPSFLQSAILNLALNARDAMPEGGRLRFVVNVENGRELEAARTDRVVQLKVEDTGSGMAPEVLEHIFEPFYTTRDDGNGMGLAAVHGTVAAHDGSIRVASEPGVGSTFTISLPFASEGAPARVAEPASPRGRFAGLRVLLAEDEHAVSKVAIAFLAELGCRVTHCSHGAQALEEFTNKSDQFDLAMLDHSMPKLSGEAVLRAIREKNPNLPVISTSGYAESMRPRQGQPDVFLAKPFDLAGLTAAIDKALGSR